MKFGIGQPVRRAEDKRFLTGGGRYIDDVNIAGQAYAHMVRSPHAHADITAIDDAEVRRQPGVLAVYTGRDVAADGLGSMPCSGTVKNRDGTEMTVPHRALLADGRVRFVGDVVAMVVAETARQAEDAADFLMVDYAPLPACCGTAAAVEEGAPQIWDHAPRNIAYDWDMGDAAAVDAAFAGAAHVVKLDLVNNRVVHSAIEPRAAIGEFEPQSGRYRLHAPSQGVFSLRSSFAEPVFHVAPEKIQVLTYDVGGGFGAKLFPYPEYGLVMWAAGKLGRAVKWTADRSQTFLSDTHGRDHVSTGELALDEDGKFLAIRVSTLANMGAYLQNFAPFVSSVPHTMLAGVYSTPYIYARVKGVFTNTVPISAYRGAGRPEAAFLLERLIDIAARRLNLPTDEIRRRNFIPPEAMPYETPTGHVYDSGDFAETMAKGLELADWKGFDERRKETVAAGKLRGIGLAYYVEVTVGESEEHARIEVTSNGAVTGYVGTQTNGQGHETAYAQIITEHLGVPFESVRIMSGDSDALPGGGGTGGSRSLVSGGGAVQLASEDLVANGRKLAADEFGVAEDQIEFVDGRFRAVGSAQSMSVVEAAAAAAAKGAAKGADEEAGLVGIGEMEDGVCNFPNGIHICEVEVDPDTGAIEIVRYAVVDDFGRVLNPLLVEGQVHGGIAQGIGQAMLELAAYDQDSGQLLSGSFTDYAMPRADHFPNLAFETNEVLCKTNWLGAKGAGEAGTIGAMPAFVSAVVDALSVYGIEHLDMPLQPERVWRAVHGASACRKRA